METTALHLTPSSTRSRPAWNAGVARSAATIGAAGTELAALGVPILAVQEGGYNTRQMGGHAQRFFHAIAAAP